MLDALLSPPSFMSKCAGLLNRVQWHGKGLFDGPSWAVDAIPKRAKRYTNFFGPLAHRLSAAIMRNVVIVRAIYHLLVLASPANVSRRVISIVVNSVQAHTGRALPKVSDEIFKHHEGGVNRYAATSIMEPLSSFGIMATGFHVSPGRVFFGPFNPDHSTWHATRVAGFPC